MAVVSSRWLRSLRFVVPVVLLLLFAVYYWMDLSLISFSNPSWNNPEITNDLQPNTKEQFIQEASTWEIDGLFNDIPLRELCASKTWQPGLIFKCEDAFGGVGNVRNIILTCIRYAIEAGGSVFPSRNRTSANQPQQLL